jgi:hypothetical protein
MVDKPTKYRVKHLTGHPKLFAPTVARLVKRVLLAWLLEFIKTFRFLVKPIKETVESNCRIVGTKIITNGDFKLQVGVLGGQFSNSLFKELI